jgi:hypothetical protein
VEAGQSSEEMEMEPLGVARQLRHFPVRFPSVTIDRPMVARDIKGHGDRINAVRLRMRRYVSILIDTASMSLDILHGRGPVTTTGELRWASGSISLFVAASS